MAYLVFRCRGRPDEASGTTGTTGPTFNAGEIGRGPTTKFSHLRAECQQQYNLPQPSLLPASTTATATASVTASSANALPPPQKAEDEFKRLRGELESLRDRCVRGGEARLADLLAAMLEDQSARRDPPPPALPPPPPAVTTGNHVPARQLEHKHNGDHEDQRERGRERRDRDRDRDRDRGVILRPTLLTVRELRVIQKGCIVQAQPARQRAYSSSSGRTREQLDNASQQQPLLSPASPLSSQLNSPLSQLNSPLGQLNSCQLGQLHSPQPDNDNGNVHTLKDSNHNDKPVDGPVATLTMVTDEVTV
ncbi:Translation initiation factor IF-2 [Frankliniella fusca]|uniref:Translation initiation factor IF-2 n=1 Tax=Frankliniella fusca TaxID=407009 RepID=A0AAE1H3W6_9NEOP|nr:Translation initiation factor IF-2 [Frankliniella fusca]